MLGPSLLQPGRLILPPRLVVEVGVQRNGRRHYKRSWVAEDRGGRYTLPFTTVKNLNRHIHIQDMQWHEKAVKECAVCQDVWHLTI